MDVTARELATLTGGTLVRGDPEVLVTSFAIDSRVLEPGACFVALIAERDGHQFVDDAFARGARVALVTRAVSATAGAVVLVDDALAALARLGRVARERMSDATVVGITGSAGKTGTKDLTAAALVPTFRVHASPGSYNNEAGVPLTLLGAPATTDALVLEIGAHARGDIAALCSIARPTVGVITNIGLAHAGPLGGRAGVAQAKGELLEALDGQGLAVLDAGDPETAGLAARTEARVLTVAVGDRAAHADAEVRADRIVLDAELRPTFTLGSPWGGGSVALALRGSHQVVNATLAATVALALGVPFTDVARGLAGVQPAAWRMEVVRTTNDVVVLDDAYNANPSSMAAALEALARVDVPGRRLAVLGEIRELGELSVREHSALGVLVGTAAVDTLVAVGAEAAPLAAATRTAGVAVTEVPDAAAALDAVSGYVVAGDAVLVKGSRAVGLELVASALRGRVRGDAR